MLMPKTSYSNCFIERIMSDLKVIKIYEVYLTGENLDKASEDFDGDKYVV